MDACSIFSMAALVVAVYVAYDALTTNLWRSDDGLCTVAYGYSNSGTVADSLCGSAAFYTKDVDISGSWESVAVPIDSM